MNNTNSNTFLFRDISTIKGVGQKLKNLLYKLEIFKLLPFFFIKKQAIS